MPAVLNAGRGRVATKTGDEVMATREQRGNKEKKKPKAEHNQKKKKKQPFGGAGMGQGTVQNVPPGWSPQGTKK
jgi:hypothetical protein